jgi:hypothetical protein
VPCSHPTEGRGALRTCLLLLQRLGTALRKRWRDAVDSSGATSAARARRRDARLALRYLRHHAPAGMADPRQTASPRAEAKAGARTRWPRARKSPTARAGRIVSCDPFGCAHERWKQQSAAAHRRPPRTCAIAPNAATTPPLRPPLATKAATTWMAERPASQSGRDLLRRPAQLQPTLHLGHQRRTQRQLRRLRPPRAPLRPPLRPDRPIPPPAPTSPDLPTHRRRRPPQRPSDRTRRLARRDPPRDPLPLLKRQPVRRMHHPPAHQRRLVLDPRRRRMRQPELDHHLPDQRTRPKPRHHPRTLHRRQQPIPPTLPSQRTLRSTRKHDRVASTG